MTLQLDESAFRTANPPFDAEGRYRPVSFWHETADMTPGQPLEGDTTCDIAVVGGGFTGLSVAHALKRLAPERDVVVLERAVAGHGASGRNGGFAMPLLGWDLLYTARKLGEAAAGAVYRVMYEAVAHVKGFTEEYGIDCDLEATGYVLLNTCAGRERRAREEFELAHRLGFDHVWLDKRELQAYIRGNAFRSGVFDPHPCVLNPAKLSRSLKRAAENIGVRVFEQTPLLALTEGPRIALRTPKGGVRAGRVVLAVNGYGGSLGFMPARILPVHTYIVLTEPLTDAQLGGIGWGAKRASLETARNFIHYFRLTADNRIAFGGEDAQLYWKGRYFDGDKRVFEALKARFRAYFPSLAGVRFTHEWGGVLGVTLDMFPSFGVRGAHGNIYYAGGYSGHGVALANYAGVLLAPHILADIGGGRADTAPPPFWNRLPPYLFQQPLRYAGMQVYRAALRAQDVVQRA